jgi:hypothetical protein
MNYPKIQPAAKRLYSLLLLLTGLIASPGTVQATGWSFNLPTGAAAQTDEGEGIQLRGAANFDPQHGTASGGGAFTVYNAFDEADGPIFHGTWVVTGFKSFVSEGGPSNGFQGGIVQVTVTLLFKDGSSNTDVVLTATCPFINGAFQEENDAIVLTGDSLGEEQFIHPAGGFVAIHKQ